MQKHILLVSSLVLIFFTLLLVSCNNDIKDDLKIASINQLIIENKTLLGVTEEGRKATKIVISDDVTSIGEKALYSCTMLTSIIMPSNLDTIGPYALMDCNKIKSITLPDSVKEIENSAFMKCSSLESITIPNKVTEISRYLFEECESLTTVAIPESVKKLTIVHSFPVLA